MAWAIEPRPLNFADGQPFANSKYFECGDYNIHYRVDEPKCAEIGKIFMVHGFGCNTAFFDELVEQYTAMGYYVVRADLPDFGYSTREEKGIVFIPETTLMHKLIEHISAPEDKWVLLGHSMGGSVVLQMATEDESRLKGVILNAPLLMANVPGFVGNLMKGKLIGNVMNVALKYLAGHDALGPIIMYLMTFALKYSKGIDPERVLGPFKIQKTGTGLAFMTAKTSKPSKEAIHNIKTPIQLVWGGIDIFVLPTARKSLEKALPESAQVKMLVLGNHCLINNFDKKVAKWGHEFMQAL